MEFEIKRWKEKYVDLLADAISDADFILGQPVENAADFICKRLLADEKAEFCRAVIVDGQLAGGVSIRVGSGVFRCAAEMSCWISRDFSGQNILPAAAAAVCRDAFRRLEDIEQITALTPADNLPARSLLNDCGFELKGTLLRSMQTDSGIRDCCIYELLRSSAITAD